MTSIIVCIRASLLRGACHSCLRKVQELAKMLLQAKVVYASTANLNGMVELKQEFLADNSLCLENCLVRSKCIQLNKMTVFACQGEETGYCSNQRGAATERCHRPTG